MILTILTHVMAAIMSSTSLLFGRGNSGVMNWMRSLNTSVSGALTWQDRYNGAKVAEI